MSNMLDKAFLFYYLEISNDTAVFTVVKRVGYEPQTNSGIVAHIGCNGLGL